MWCNCLRSMGQHLDCAIDDLQLFDTNLLDVPCDFAFKYFASNSTHDNQARNKQALIQ